MATNVHNFLDFTDVREQVLVTKDVDRRLIVKQDPALRQYLFLLMERQSCEPRHQELE